jgi:hypothetical protein
MVSALRLSCIVIQMFSDIKLSHPYYQIKGDDEPAESQRAARRPRLDDDDEDEDTKPAAIASTPRTNSSMLNIPSQLRCMPIHAIAEYKNSDMQEMVSVAILLPSGVNTPDASKVKVSEDQLSLNVTIKWPAMISNVTKLHLIWNQVNAASFPPFHPRIQAFDYFFSNLRQRENDDLFSMGTIPLGGGEVLKNIVSLTRMGTEGGERILFVDLQRVRSVDYKESPDADFTIVKA